MKNTLHVFGKVVIHYGHRRNGQFCSKAEKKRQYARINRLMGQHLAEVQK